MNIFSAKKDNMDIFEAIKRGDDKIVKSKMSQPNFDIAMRDLNGNTLLMIAADKLKLDILEILLRVKGGHDKAILNAKNNEGKTALMIVSSARFELVYGQTNSPDTETIYNIITALIRYGADVNIRDNKGYTTLMYLVDSKLKSCFRILKQAGADVNIESTDGKTALSKSVVNFDNGQNLETLIDTYKDTIDIDKKNQMGQTAFMMGVIGLIKLDTTNTININTLRSKGANINIKDNNGATSLMHASKSTKPYLVKFLINADANANIQDNYNNTALMYCALGGNVQIADILIPETYLYIRNDLGQTAMDIASIKNNAGVVAAIKNTLNYKGDKDDKIISDFSDYCNIKELDDLISEGFISKIDNGVGKEHFFINIPNKGGNTPLLSASLNQYCKVTFMDKIIKMGANINAKNNNEDNAMHLACLRSNKDVVRFLLVQGIDYNAINKQGKTPRDILQKRSNEQINEQIIKDIDKWSIISDVSPEVMASYRKLDIVGINALFDEHKGGKKSTKSKRKKVKKTKKYRKRTKRR